MPPPFSPPPIVCPPLLFPPVLGGEIHLTEMLSKTQKIEL